MTNDDDDDNNSCEHTTGLTETVFCERVALPVF